MDLYATTACLSAVIVMQIVNVFSCRSATRSAFSTGLLGSQLILWVVLELVLILLIVYTSWGNLLLETAPIGVNVWPFVAPFGVALLVLEELRKYLVGRKRWRKNCAAGDVTRTPPDGSANRRAE